jgi:predicted PurR-regulated permease PerM
MVATDQETERRIQADREGPRAGKGAIGHPVPTSGTGGFGGVRAPIVTVAFSSRTITVIATVVALLWLGSRLTDLLLVLSFAVVLAAAVDGPLAWLERRGVPRPIGVPAIFAVLALVLAGLVVALIPLVNDELVMLRDGLPNYAARIERLVHWLAPSAGSTSSISFGTVATQLSGHLTTLAGQLTTVTLATGRALVLGFATVVIAYFLAVDPSIGARLLARFAPPSIQERAASVVVVAHQRIGAWVRGQALVALTFGGAMGLGLWLLGVPYAVSLGIVAAILELIPYVGGAVIVLLAVLAAAMVGTPQILGVIALYLVLVAIESHVLSPVFVGHLVGLPPVAILVALLVGTELLGIAGVLLAVPLTVIAWAVIDEIWPDPRARSASAGRASGSTPGATSDADTSPASDIR